MFTPDRLPGATNALVSAILKANPNTIVINQSGTPVEMPWIDEAHTLLQVIAFYPPLMNSKMTESEFYGGVRRSTEAMSWEMALQMCCLGK